MAAWQDSRIEGGTAPEGERIKRRGGSKASKRDWTWCLGASQHCAGLGHGREAWGHGLEGRWKPAGAVQSRRTFTARTSKALVQLQGIEGEHGLS
jgi:hypothetical protein